MIVLCIDCCRRLPIGNEPYPKAPLIEDERWYRERCFVCIMRHGFTGKDGPVSEPVARDF